MKLAKSILVFALNFSLFSVSFLSFTTQTVFAQDARAALQRGYRTGYSDGYMSGYRDAIDSKAKSVESHDDYAKADRAYVKEYGALADYQDGYQQGFESGYNSGFDKRPFDSAIPMSLTKRGVVSVKTPAETKPAVEEKTETIPEPQTPAPIKTDEIIVAPVNQTPAPDTVSDSAPIKSDDQVPVIKTSYSPKNSIVSGADAIVIPTDTELIVELLDDINTDRNREGDRFKARVVSPSEISGAIVEGRIQKIRKPGRIKRRSEMTLSFDRIIVTDNRWSNFNAILTEVLPVKGDNVRRVDVEGTVEGRRTLKEDSIKVGATTGTGLIVGAIAGGPVGAAVGAGVGAAFGVGAVVVERGKHIRLNQDQQLRIRTNYETQIR